MSGGPDGDVKCVLVLDGGRIAETPPGAATDAELTMTLDYATAAEIAAGDLDPSVAFMQGRSKAAGDTGVLLQLLPLARTDAYRALRDKLNADHRVLTARTAVRAVRGGRRCMRKARCAVAPALA